MAAACSSTKRELRHVPGGACGGTSCDQIAARIKDRRINNCRASCPAIGEARSISFRASDPPHRRSSSASLRVLCGEKSGIVRPGSDGRIAFDDASRKDQEIHRRGRRVPQRKTMTGPAPQRSKRFASADWRGTTGFQYEIPTIIDAPVPRSTFAIKASDPAIVCRRNRSWPTASGPAA